MTNRILRHIAIFSLLVFAYPIAFMTFHVLHDHLPVNACMHSCCSLDIHSKQQEQGELAQLSENTHCLLCEYEFAKNHSHRSNPVLPVEKFIIAFCEGICNQTYLVFSGTNKSLRAPPVMA